MTLHSRLALLGLGALALLPARAHAQDLLAHARDVYRRGQVDSAYDLIKSAAEAQPNRAEVHYWLGQIAADEAQHQGPLNAMGAARACKAGYSRAVQLEPDNVQYLEALISFLAQAPAIAGGDRDSALVLAHRVRRLDDAKGSFAEAVVLRTGSAAEKARADSLVEVVMAAHPNDRVIQYRASTMFSQTNRPERALAIYQRMLARDSTDGMARFGVARNLVVLGRDPRVAQRHLRYVIGLPLPPEGQPRWIPEAAWWRLGQAYVQLGVPDSARAAFGQALRMNAQFRQAQASLDSLPHR